MSLIISKEYAAEIAATAKAVAPAPAPKRLHLEIVSADAYTADMAREDAIACGAVRTGIADACYGLLEVSVDGPEGKYYTLRTYNRMGGVNKGGSLGLTLFEAMRGLLARRNNSLHGFVVLIIEDATNDLRHRCIGFGKYPNVPVRDLIASEDEAQRKFIANYAKAARLDNNGKPCLLWDKGWGEKPIKKAIPTWLYDTLIAIKAEQDELARAYKAEQTEAKATTSFRIGEVKQRVDDILTVTRIIAYIDPRVCYINGETHSYKARFTNKDGQVVEAYANNRDHYTVGESFPCRMTVTKHYINKEGERVTCVNRITKK